MPPLKVGRNHLFLEDIRNVITPTSQGENCLEIVYRNGDREPFYSEEAEIIRAWLATQLDPPRPATVPFVQTKSEPAAANKSAPRR